MIEIDVPGWRSLRLQHLVLDVNGTIALDGELLPGVADRIAKLRGAVDPHLLSGDTYDQLDNVAALLQVDAVRLRKDAPAAKQKAVFIRSLGAAGVVAIGNGANDVAMLQEAALSIGVLGSEGLALVALAAAHVLVPSIGEGLDLLAHPRRLVATLRR